MFLREHYSNAEQVAMLVSISHAEWEQQFISGHEEEMFDGWLDFLGTMAVQMTVPEPRVG